jgi:shikimate kinase
VRAHLLGRPPAVIAAAASVVDDPQVLDLLAELAVTVWLRGDADVVVLRAAQDPHRPMLDRPDEMVDLARRRAPLFAETADVVVGVGTATPQELADGVVAELTRRGLRR